MDVSRVGCLLAFDVTAPAELVLRIAVLHPAGETLTVSAGGSPVEPVELDGRQHYLRVPAGPLTISYAAEVMPDEPVPTAVSGAAVSGALVTGAVVTEAVVTEAVVTGAVVTEAERVEALRPSRYCPSDRMLGFAARQFGPAPDASAIAGWVFEHLSYEVGSSTVSTDAVDTMLSGAGVCRDYAHLTAALCRAVGIPARVAAVYAPGLSPMDFHLVVETGADGSWRVWDATRLAPRPSLIRIATGRDAADTAFATTLSGAVTLTDLQITAVAASDLAIDDHRSAVTIR